MKTEAKKQETAGGNLLLPDVRVQMPCGTNHSCFKCYGFIAIDTCTHLNKLTEEQYSAHVKMLYERESNGG